MVTGCRCNMVTAKQVVYKKQLVNISQGARPYFSNNIANVFIYFLNCFYSTRPMINFQGVQNFPHDT